MDIGVFLFSTGYNSRLDELGKELEERGYESLFQPEHTHIPTSRESPFPAGGDLPREYSSTYDPFVSLSFAAAATTKLKVGTGICLIPQRDPIVTAKAVASLDAMSNGRFLFGIGGGWNKEEMRNHGAEYKTRFKLMRERILAMKALWTQDEASFHGEYVDFDPVWSYPKPAQQPHPPVLLGGETDYTLARVVEFCDGWFPRGSTFDPVKDMQRLRDAAEKAGRDPAELSVSVFRAPADKQKLEEYAQAGVDRAILELPPASRDGIMSRLDDYESVIC
jgi:probable F420-dependent oxidoreductase